MIEILDTVVSVHGRSSSRQHTWPWIRQWSLLRMESATACLKDGCKLFEMVIMEVLVKLG